jgi:hypothetical protein
MKISIEKAPHYKEKAIWCDNDGCRKLPECFESRETYGTNYGGEPNIKHGTLIAVMYNKGMGGSFNRQFYFCRDCIDLVYRDVKKVMDSSLWAFH